MPCERRSLIRSAIASSSVTTAPPSPTARFLFEKNENAPAAPKVPTWRPCSCTPMAWAASSSRTRPRSAASVADRGDVARMAAVRHRHDRPGARSDRRLDVRRRRPRPLERRDVDEPRRRAGVGDRVDGGHEGERRHDHLVAGAELGREADQMQGGRAVGDGERVARAGVLRQGALEFRRAWTHAEPARAVDVRDHGDVFLGDDDVRERDLPVGHGASVPVDGRPRRYRLLAPASRRSRTQS